jgi:hypothetical protein
MASDKEVTHRPICVILYIWIHYIKTTFCLSFHDLLVFLETIPLNVLNCLVCNRLNCRLRDLQGHTVEWLRCEIVKVV